MGKRPWMPLYVADYLADTTHLMATESGAYLHLIMHYWQTGELLDDDTRLCRIARVHPPHWKRIRRSVEPFFDLASRPGFWVHRRVDSELGKAAIVSEKRASAAAVKSLLRPGGLNTPKTPPIQYPKTDNLSNKINGSSEQLHVLETANALQTDSKCIHTHTHIERKKEETPPTPPKGGRGRKTQIAANWKLSEEGRSYALERGRDDPWIAEEAERFRDHALKNGKSYVDWEAAWRNWVKSPYQAVRPLHTNGVRPMSVRDMQRLKSDEAFSELNRRIEYDEQNGSDEGGTEAYKLIPTHNRH